MPNEKENDNKKTVSNQQSTVFNQQNKCWQQGEQVPPADEEDLVHQIVNTKSNQIIKKEKAQIVFMISSREK